MGIYFCDKCGVLILNSVSMTQYPHAPTCPTLKEDYKMDTQKQGSNQQSVVIAQSSFGPVLEREENIALLISCVKDVLDYWPQMSFRTIRIMAGKMETLKQAFALVSK